MAVAGLAMAPLSTLFGVYLGARLSKQQARDLAQDQREWSDQQAVRDRQDQVVAEFDERLMEALADVPMGVVTGRDAADAISTGWQALRHAWRRTTILDDRELEDRIAALDMALFIAGQDARSGGDEEINFWALTVALRDLRKALAAFQRHASLPEPEFPTAKQLVSLAHPNGRNVGIQGAAEWMSERGVM